VSKLRSSGRLPAKSEKVRREAKDRKRVREAVFARDGCCRLSPYGDLNPAGVGWGPCFGRPLTFHHLLKASQGGKYTMENGLTLCAGHNSLVEDYPALAYACGLVIRLTLDK
jgi:5-methylcytosine-specific restriction endonuclease McrA